MCSLFARRCSHCRRFLHCGPWSADRNQNVANFPPLSHLIGSRCKRASILPHPLFIHIAHAVPLAARPRTRWQRASFPALTLGASRPLHLSVPGTEPRRMAPGRSLPLLARCPQAWETLRCPSRACTWRMQWMHMWGMERTAPLPSSFAWDNSIWCPVTATCLWRALHIYSLSPVVRGCNRKYEYMGHP